MVDRNLHKFETGLSTQAQASGMMEGVESIKTQSLFGWANHNFLLLQWPVSLHYIQYLVERNSHTRKSSCNIDQMKAWTDGCIC